MKRTMVPLLVVLSLQGCSTLGSLTSVLTPDKPSIEVNAQVAKNAEQEKSVIKLESGGTKQTADTISNSTSTTSNADVINQIANEMTWWQYLAVIVCAGVALPSWKELYTGVKVVLSDTAGAFIVNPIKGVANFVLLILGKEKI